MNKYRLVAKKGEGTFSEVLKAQCIKNGKYVAIKCMKNHFDSLDQVNNLREIQALRRLSPHPHIIKLLEVLYDQPTGRLALVFELMDMNIYELIRGRRHYVAEDRVRAYLYQLMKALDHMHRNGIFHRDIKPENILIMDDVLKLADFGSCRGIYSKQPYTEYISTRWYRAPECLLTDGFYNYKMDMWGVGCVMFEIVALYPLFPSNNELDQIQKIHTIIGTPPPELLARLKKRSSHSSASFEFPPCQGSGLAKMLAHVHPDCADLISKLLAYNPDERLSARQALRHPYFRERREADKRAKAALQPDLMGSACLSAMDSEYSMQQQQQPQHAAGAAGLRRTDSEDQSDAGAAGAAGGAGDAQEAAAAGSGSMWHHQAVGAANTAAAAAGVAGVLGEHLAAVAAAAAAAVAAAAAAGGGMQGAAGAHGSLPAINSSVKAQQQQQQQQHAPALPAHLHMQQQQQHHRQWQPLPAHHTNSSTSSQHQPHALPAGRHQQQQPPQPPQHPQAGPHAGSMAGLPDGLQGHQLFGGGGHHSLNLSHMHGTLGSSSSLKDRDGSIMQLMAEASSLSQACQALPPGLQLPLPPAVHGGCLPGLLGLQASTGSLWQEGSSAAVGGMLGQQQQPCGQALPPLVGKGAGGAGGTSGQHSARRHSHLGHSQVPPQHHSIKQQQQPYPALNSGTGIKAAAGAQQQLASKAGMLQQQALHARSGHHGMQISSARYHKQSSSGRSNNMLQPAGSLASSMSNLHCGVKAGRGSGGGGGGAGVAGSRRAQGGQPYVSPYGQQQQQQQQQQLRR